MIKRYEAAHAFDLGPLTLIFPEGAYDILPIEIRMLEPWFGCSYGDMANLKPALRDEISRKGYAIVREAFGMLDAA